MKLDSFDKFKTKDDVEKHISYLPIDYQQHLLDIIAESAYKEYKGYTFTEVSEKKGALYTVGFNCNHEIGAVYLTEEDLRKAFHDNKQQ